MEKLISVIIPTYKDRGKLKNAVDSVLNQTYKNIEILVIDDNGVGTEYQKRTSAVMEEYSSNTRVKYLIHEVNKNGAAARNTGIKASSGEFIAFLDDDDSFRTLKLETQIDYFDSHPEFDALYCFAAKGGKDIKTEPYEGDASLPLLLGKTSMFTPSLIFKRFAIQCIGGFDETFRRHQDYELLLRFFSKGYKIGCVPRTLLDIGINKGENILHGDSLVKLKQDFLSQFDDVITKLDSKKPGIKRKIIAHHYAVIFIDSLKQHDFCRCCSIFFKYGSLHPSVFLKPIYKSAIHYLFKK